MSIKRSFFMRSAEIRIKRLVISVKLRIPTSYDFLSQDIHKKDRPFYMAVRLLMLVLFITYLL